MEWVDEAQSVPLLHNFWFLWRHKMRKIRGEVGKKTPKKYMDNPSSKVVQIGLRQKISWNLIQKLVQCSVKQDFKLHTDGQIDLRWLFFISEQFLKSQQEDKLEHLRARQNINLFSADNSYDKMTTKMFEQEMKNRRFIGPGRLFF